MSPDEKTREEGAWMRLVRFGFRLLYNELAWTYDGVSWLVSLGEWSRWQADVVRFVDGERVLEIAHGPGHTLLTLERRGFEVVGCDLSPAMGRLAERRMQAAGFDIPLVRNAVQALPFRSETFDSVLSQFPTDFIAESATLDAIWRVLRPGGRLVILPEGHLTGGGLVTQLIDGLYALTGQPTGNTTAVEAIWARFDAQLQGTGFQVDRRLIQLQRSAYSVIIATKMGGS